MAYFQLGSTGTALSPRWSVRITMFSALPRTFRRFASRSRIYMLASPEEQGLSHIEVQSVSGRKI
jgi:hypothetical protein